MKERKFTFFIFLALLLTSSLRSQDIYSRPRSHNSSYVDVHQKLREGVEVVIEQPDGFGQVWGVDSKQLEDVAQIAVRGTGWSINNGSSIALTVSINPLSGSGDDLHTFLVEIHVGSTEIRSGMDEFPGSIGDISAKRAVSIRKGDPSFLSATIHEMVTKVATKLRREITRLSLEKSRLHNDVQDDDDRLEY